MAYVSFRRGVGVGASLKRKGHDHIVFSQYTLIIRESYFYKRVKRYLIAECLRDPGKIVLILPFLILALYNSAESYTVKEGIVKFHGFVMHKELHKFTAA